MTLQPLLHTSWAIQTHVAAVTAALVVGAWLIYFSRKGAPGHRALGVLFLGLMSLVALSALFIHKRTPHSAFFGFSLTHLFVPCVLVMVWMALRSAMRGDIRLHRFCTRGLYMGGLVVNAAINLFLVHGVVHDVVFPAPTTLQAKLDTPAAIHGDRWP
jgi:uncharacterized membrane protein